MDEPLAVAPALLDLDPALQIDFALKEASQSEGLNVSQTMNSTGEDGKVNEKQAETGVFYMILL